MTTANSDGADRTIGRSFSWAGNLRDPREKPFGEPISDTVVKGNQRSVGSQRELFFQTVARDLNWKSVKDHEEMSRTQEGSASGKKGEGSDDNDRKNHDVANLLVLPFLCYFTVKSIIELEGWEREHVGVTGLARASLPKPPCWWWHLCNASFVTYFIADSLWIHFRPRCVRSSAVIFTHHFVTMFGYIVSYSYLEGPIESRYRMAMLGASMVEVKTAAPLEVKVLLVVRAPLRVVAPSTMSAPEDVMRSWAWMVVPE